MKSSLRLLVITTAILSVSWFSWFNKLTGVYESINVQGGYLSISESGKFSITATGSDFVREGNWEKIDGNKLVLSFSYSNDHEFSNKKLTAIIESNGDITFGPVRFRKK